jgi:hypothetical protein
MADSANDKPVSRYQVELLNASYSPEKGGWLRLDGKLKSGRTIHGTLFDGPANALHKKLGAIVPEGENIASMNLMIDIEGRWVERASTPGNDGAEKKNSRYFKIHEFDVLDGRALEIARISRDSARVLEVSQKVTTVEDAYQVLAEFVARLGRVTYDPSASAYLSKSHGVDAGLESSDEVPASDPEEDAARRYEEQDRVSGLTGAILDAPELATNPTAEPVAEVSEAAEVDETPDEPQPQFDEADEVVLTGSTEEAENAMEIESITLEDDNPLSAETVTTEEDEPDFTESTEADDVQADDVSEPVEEPSVEEPAPVQQAAPANTAARPSAPARPGPPSRIPPRPSAPTSAPGPRR